MKQPCDPNSYVDYETGVSAIRTAREYRVIPSTPRHIDCWMRLWVKAMDKTKLALLALCVALAGVVVWQRSSYVAMVAPPEPLQVTSPAAAPSAFVSAAPVNPPATEAPAVVSEAAAEKTAPKETVSKKPAPRTSAPRRGAVVEIPAATTTSRSTAATPAVAPARTVEPVAAPVVEAAHAANVTSFTVIHDHSKGNFEKDPKASCVGELVISATEIKFEGAGAGESHHFEASWSEVLDAGSNKFFGSGIGGFHVTIKPDGKYQNINLVPKSKDKAEAKAIVDLLNSKRTDRGQR